jgi:hypothetical protein
MAVLNASVLPIYNEQPRGITRFNRVLSNQFRRQLIIKIVGAQIFFPKNSLTQ